MFPVFMTVLLEIIKGLIQYQVNSLTFIFNILPFFCIVKFSTEKNLFRVWKYFSTNKTKTNAQFIYELKFAIDFATGMQLKVKIIILITNDWE